MPTSAFFSQPCFAAGVKVEETRRILSWRISFPGAFLAQSTVPEGRLALSEDLEVQRSAPKTRNKLTQGVVKEENVWTSYNTDTIPACQHGFIAPLAFCLKGSGFKAAFGREG